MDEKVQDLTVVLFGNSSAVDFGDENMLLGPQTAHYAGFSPIAPQSRMLSSRSVAVINILDFQENENDLVSMDQRIARLINEHKIHAFVFVLQLCRLTDSDKTGLEWLQNRFGKDVRPFVMILFTYEREEECDNIIDDLKKNSVLEHLLQKCENRYHTCSKRMNDQSEMRTLLEKIDDMVSENKQRCYTVDLYTTASNLREHQHEGSQLQEDDMSLAGSKQTVKRKSVSPDEAKHSVHNYEEKENPLTEQIDQLFNRLQLKRDHKQKLNSEDVLQIKSQSLCFKKPQAENDLVQAFLQRLLLADYRARYISIEEPNSELHQIQSSSVNNEDEDPFASLFSGQPVSHEATKKQAIHSMDVQMAVFHCSDNFLKQLIVTKLSQCQYALPLLVPNPFTEEIEFPLWTFRQIRKSWKTPETADKKTSKTMQIFEAQTPMVAFLRIGSISSSKSQLINDLINERHNTFAHRHDSGSSRDRLLMDGVVEIAWYLPSGKSTDHFTDCVAFCNLHGDAKTHEKQLKILTELSSVNVVLSDDHKTITNKGILKKLYKISKPLICLLCEDDSKFNNTVNLIHVIGLKDQNKSHVSKQIRNIIKHYFSQSSAKFSLEMLGKKQEITVDENNEQCQKGMKSAVQIIELQKENELLSKIKETQLPCQRQPWHDWCKKKKELHRLQGSNIEKQMCEKLTEMKQIREIQHKLGPSELMRLFIHSMKSLKENEKCYFLKWLRILLDNSTTHELSCFRHTYDETWTKILDLKRKNEKLEEMKDAQAQLEEISKKMSAAAFGMEHILREMGQIYESAAENGKNETCLSKIAVDIILAGHPLELMDGDTGHVPLIWVTAVLDELIDKLGDQRVFVLSVLGIQSSGKSTMLNAMFGLQFAVSAGRCTKGAFMQLVKVAKEMKEQLKFDYIFVVDTEGLRALEFTGLSTREHDNGLATFVVGLGNMTLINIFGENPTEMQDILQIVVQALLRMKKVRLNTSCMFVHQNVGEVTAAEGNMEGRKRLLDKLDEMTKLAAKEENCNAKSFSDVIAFDVKNDVWYFAQLWEGNPPMALPNHAYCENIQKLKGSIISKISTSCGVKFSGFKEKLSSLWNALLDENFVFSFRNILEIIVYRRLENEYSKWTWSLRSAILAIENKLHNRVNNENSLKIDEKDIMGSMKQTKTDVETSIKKFFDEDQDKDILIQWQERFQIKISELCNELVERTKRKLDEVIRLKMAREKIDCEKKRYEDQLFNRSKDLAFCLRNKETEDDALNKEFEDVWTKWVSELTLDTPSFGEINIWGDITNILSDSYDLSLVCERQNRAVYKRIYGNYSDYAIFNDQDDMGQDNLQEDKHSSDEKPRASTFTSEDSDSLRDFIRSTTKDTEEDIQKMPIAEHGYSHIYIPEIIEAIKNKVKAYESKTINYILKKEFTVDLCLHVCDLASEKFEELHKKFKEAYDIKMYLERQKPHYLNIFKNYCHGATSTAVFGEFIVDKLEPSILQATYDQTAIDLSKKMKRDVPAFSGNKSNLEKHILKSLAKEEIFENYIQYIHNPRGYFSSFIKNKVHDYIFKENCSVVLETITNNVNSKVKCVMDAVNEATEEVKSRHGDVNLWLQQLSRKLQDEVQFQEKSFLEQKEITDFDFLQKVVNKGLTTMMSKLSNKFQLISDLQWEIVRKKPDEILTEQLCHCCWAQCPFCSAICTNTLKDHTGDHSVHFHRNPGISGWSYKFTNELGLDFCTTAVTSDFLHFHTSGKVFSFKDYRKAGGEYARWDISPDHSEMPYWKWFVCTFQDKLEKHYKKQFKGHGEIPQEWKNYTKARAIKSLCEL